MLIPLKNLLQKARQDNFAIGAFNTCNLEITQAIIKAAENKNMPVIIQATENSLKYMGLKAAVAMVKSLAEDSSAEICLHLDHGKSYESVCAAIDAGFPSVLIDGSKLPLEENIALTKKVVEYAHEKNVCVQGEINNMPGGHGECTSCDDIAKAGFTNPDEAKKFIEETCIDTLAVAIGNAHGFYKGGNAKLQIDVLEKIKNAVDAPLVLHGGSGIPDQKIKKAIAAGISIINIDSHLGRAFEESLRDLFDSSLEGLNDPRKILAVGRNAVQKAVEEKMEVFYAK